MRRILFVLIIANASVAMAASFTKGEGHFLTKDGDSHQFIKDQLIHEGIKSIVSKELDTLQLNKELFWNKYNEKLNERYIQIEEDYKVTTNITESTDKKKMERFKDQLRIKQLKYRRNFASMNSVLRKFSVKKISRSPRNPKYRIIRLEGQIDTNLLTKTYYNFVRGKRTSDYGSLFLNTKYTLNGITYSELGIDNENDFEGEVTKNWLDWFSKNKPMNIANTELLDEDKENKLTEYFKLPTEIMLTNIPEVFVNSLLLDIEIIIKKKSFDKTLNTYTFEYEGHAFLKDLQTNLVLSTYKFEKTEKSYRLTPELSIANIVANHVYHMAKGSFPRIEKKIKEITPVSTIQRVRLSEFKNIKQLNSFINLIEERGVKYSLKVKLESINRTNADLILFYDGETEEVKTLFSALRSAKKDLSFDLIDTDNVLGIKFNSVIEKI
jgi:hypothetical protein